MLALLALSLLPFSPIRPDRVVTPQTVTGIEIANTQSSTDLDLVQQAGAGWVRIAGVWWPDVEPVEGQRNWAALDWLGQELLTAQGDNLAVVLVVRGTPGWAQAIPGTSCGPIRQDKLSAFAEFVSKLVKRYSREPYFLKYYELGNEPDIDPKLVQSDSLWGCWGNDADAYYGGGTYAAMLRAVYPQVKQVDPTAQVLVGGLTLDCDPRPQGGCPTEQRRRPARFLEGILRAGGGSYFDGISFHSYDYYDQKPGLYSNSNFHSSSVTTGPVSHLKAKYLRQLLAAYDVGDKYLLNTESAVLCKVCQDDPGYEWTKAYYAAQANVTALADDLRANIWFRLADWPGTALVGDNFVNKPAYQAYSVVSMMLDRATFIRVLTFGDEGEDSVRGYVFQHGGRDVWVLWSADGQTHQLSLPAMPHAVINVLGQRVLMQSTQLTLQPPGRLLVYVEW